MVITEDADWISVITDVCIPRKYTALLLSILHPSRQISHFRAQRLSVLVFWHLMKSGKKTVSASVRFMYVPIENPN